MPLCGTPYSYRTGWDVAADFSTDWDLSNRKEDYTFSAVDKMPNQCCKRWVKIMWLIVLKAANRLRSRWAVQ